MTEVQKDGWRGPNSWDPSNHDRFQKNILYLVKILNFKKNKLRK